MYRERSHPNFPASSYIGVIQYIVFMAPQVMNDFELMGIVFRVSICKNLVKNVKVRPIQAEFCNILDSGKPITNNFKRMSIGIDHVKRR